MNPLEQQYSVERIRAALQRLGRVGRGVQLTLLLGTCGVTLALVAPFFRAAVQAKPVSVPPTMEEVKWNDPQSSLYCLACHRQLSVAMAGLDVQRGHSQNVALSEAQLAVVREMGTVAGPGGTLICMSCHKLGKDSSAYMLADTLEDSRLCRRCHLGHYAQGTPHDLRQSAPAEKNRLGQTVAEGGPCSACHLSHRYARDIVSSPLDPDGYCITCHQAYHVAAGRAREKMQHPASHCLQCHNPHDMASGSFLKAPANDLCLRCHSKLGGGTAAGMHPLGPMNRPVPTELRPLGTTSANRPPEVTCATCHSMHKGGNPPLLRTGGDSNELCLACHKEELAAKSPHGTLTRHAQSPVLNEAQQAVVAKWGNAIGPNGELLCVSCHRVHGGQANSFLLAEEPRYEEMCAQCHPQTLSVVGSAHDLRTNYPQLANANGLTPMIAGVCSACHQAHGSARERTPTDGDPSGDCVSCHRAGQCAQRKAAAGVNHPETACGDCHNPHDRRFGDFLAEDTATLCARCHKAEASVIGGPHDQTTCAHPDKWPARAQKESGPCLPCHVPHGGQRADSFRIEGSEPVSNHDDVCLSCHADAAWGANSNVAAIHPQKIAPEHSRVDLALVPTDAAGAKRMGCRTCHNPHGGAEPIHLARVGPDEPTQALCVRCHREKEYVKYTGHSAEKIKAQGFQSDSCKPCHALHAHPDATWGQMLSPRFLQDRCVQQPGAASTCLPCLACHYEGGPAHLREKSTHPEMIMLNISAPNDPGYLPLFNAAGRETPDGQVVCRTCHVSHGRLELLQMMANNIALTPEQKSAVRAQVRSYVAPNVCSACHGDEGRSRYLYFHNAEMRKRALEMTPQMRPR
ncbi:MAG TPA: cytochrome c3 family protein [Phycisphaerae bacterium]|nr:cytochrome c3 family protein [Phycisphaerae bacterium]